MMRRHGARVVGAAVVGAASTALLAATALASSTTVPPDTAPATTEGLVTESVTGGASAAALRSFGSLTVFVAVFGLLLFVTWPSKRRSQELAARAARPKVEGGPIKRLTALVDNLLARSGKQRALAKSLDIAAIPLRPGEFVVVAGVVGLLVILALGASLPFAMALIIGGVLTPIGTRAYLRQRIESRRKKFVSLMPDMLQTMVSSLRAGYGLPQALDVAANQAPEPMRSELQRVLFEQRIGRDPGEALANVAERMDSKDFTWVVSAMQINREVGGELAVVLENVGETIRERQRLRRQIDVLTAEGRLSAYVITALPILVAFVLLLTNREYFEPFGRDSGPFLVLFAGALMAAGWVWIRKIVKAVD
ncbi:MAG: type II secretion system F family protein [Ilumatobacteraceae bacterium]